MASVRLSSQHRFQRLFETLNEFQSFFVKSISTNYNILCPKRHEEEEAGKEEEA